MLTSVYYQTITHEVITIHLYHPKPDVYCRKPSISRHSDKTL